MTALFNPATWAPVILAWSFLLLPFGRSSELPMFIMAILGSILIWKHGKRPRGKAAPGLSACFGLGPLPGFFRSIRTQHYSAYWSVLIGWILAVTLAKPNLGRI